VQPSATEIYQMVAFHPIKSWLHLLQRGNNFR